MMIQLIVDKTQTLKDFTDTAYAQASFCFATLLKNKEIKVNGKKTGENIIVNVGDCVQYYLTEKQAQKTAYYILYQDENVCVIDKESGVNAEAVYAGLCRQLGNGCRFIHRLDRNTRGLMVFALNDGAEKALLTAFKNRMVEKRYHALCFHSFPKDTGVLTAYLKKDENKSLVKIYNTSVVGSEKIITEYKVLQYKNGQTQAEITLHTGKTHQIRAHLAHIGCPIVGDMKYGDEKRNKALGIARQCLVAKSLRFHLDGEWSYLNEKQFTSRFEV